MTEAHICQECDKPRDPDKALCDACFEGKGFSRKEQETEEVSGGEQLARAIDRVERSRGQTAPPPTHTIPGDGPSPLWSSSGGVGGATLPPRPEIDPGVGGASPTPTLDPLVALITELGIDPGIAATPGEALVLAYQELLVDFNRSEKTVNARAAQGQELHETKRALKEERAVVASERRHIEHLKAQLAKIKEGAKSTSDEAPSGADPMIGPPETSQEVWALQAQITQLRTEIGPLKRFMAELEKEVDAAPTFADMFGGMFGIK